MFYVYFHAFGLYFGISCPVAGVFYEYFHAFGLYFGLSCSVVGTGPRRPLAESDLPLGSEKNLRKS